MKLLYCYSQKARGQDLIWALLENDIEVELCPHYLIAAQSGEDRQTAALELTGYIREKKLDGAISWNYFPALSDACEKMGVPYISWLFDSPLLHVYASNMHNSCNYIFAFDRQSTNDLKQQGANAYYMPLAVNTTRISALEIKDEDIARYSGDIAFVGSLYQNNPYRDQFFSPEDAQLFHDTFNKQAGSWHNHILKELCGDICERYDITNVIDGIEDYPYASDVTLLFGFMAAGKMGEIERAKALNMLGKSMNVTLYNSEDNKDGLTGVNCQPAVEYENEAPKVFFSSKINLNITLRSIETGIPLRAYDVMSVGGFLLSNYQEEFNELYEPGRDMVMYSDYDELCDKALYYLSHERERLTIAMNGYQKTCKYHTMRQRVGEMLRITFTK